MRKIPQRFKENPFVGDMFITTKNKQVQLSTLGKNSDILVNQSTGEIHGTHVVTHKKVDSETFLKLFTRNIGLTFELKASGIKAFGVMAWSLQQNGISNDQIPLDKFVLEEFLASNKSLKFSLTTFSRGLVELEQAQIIAKTLRQGVYFINPNFIFNGDRIAFTTLIERNKSATLDNATRDLFEKDATL